MPNLPHSSTTDPQASGLHAGPRTPQLGALLVRLGLVSAADLEAALLRQSRDGGRLGTCLAELGLLDSATFAAALGAQRGLPTVGPRLANPDPEVTRLLSPRAAAMLSAVPYERLAAGIAVAIDEAASLARLDELRALLRSPVVPHLATELQLAQALERSYGLELPPRLRRALDRIAQRERLSKLDLTDGRS